VIYLRVSFFIGLVIAIIALLIGCLLKDYNITLKITGIVSVSCIVILLYGELFYPLKVKLFNLEKACLKAN